MTFVLIFILILVGLIIVHEFGHFIVAKSFRIRVDEFGIFFPPRLLKYRWGETLYSLGALPFGGFVKIFGEDGESAAAPDSFSRKSRWAQAAVVVAGVAFNALFAWLILSVGYVAGLPASADHDGYGAVTNDRPTIVGVLPGSPAERAGLAGGDVVVALETGATQFNLRTLSRNRQAETVRDFIAEHQDESIIFSVMRGSEEHAFLARAEEGILEGRKAVGIELDDIGVLKLPAHLALLEGATQTWRMTVSIAQGLGSFFGSLFRGGANFSSVAGPIGIVAFGASAVSKGYAPVILLTALISINLALINLLPIPGLDGGRLVIIAIEGLSRRKVPERLTTALTIAGFAALILLMLVVSFYDIARLAS